MIPSDRLLYVARSDRDHFNWTPQQECQRMSPATLALRTARFVTPDGCPQLTISPPQRIVVLCTGTVEGDGACLLATEIAHITGASVRAVAVLQATQAAQVIKASTNDPVKTILTNVTQQLYRTTALPGLWGFTLLVGDLIDQLERACHDNNADLLILPATECEEQRAHTLGIRASTAVMLVSTSVIHQDDGITATLV